MNVLKKYIAKANIIVLIVVFILLILYILNIAICGENNSQHVWLTHILYITAFISLLISIIYYNLNKTKLNYLLIYITFIQIVIFIIFNIIFKEELREFINLIIQDFMDFLNCYGVALGCTRHHTSIYK